MLELTLPQTYLGEGSVRSVSPVLPATLAGLQSQPGNRRRRPAQPDEAAAHVLVNRMLEESPDAREFAARDGVAVIIEVPSGEWVDPVTEAWRSPNGGGQRSISRPSSGKK
jgi:hypothetical protein